MFGGTLKGLTSLTKSCPCDGAAHAHIVGREKSKASGEYPAELCRAYGKLAAQHFLMMGKAEFLDARHRNLKKVINKLKEKADEMWKEYGKMAPTTPPRRAPPDSPEGAPVKKRRREPGEEETTEPASSLVWKGGRGRHGMIKESKARKEFPQNLAFVGGMRNPSKAVESLPTVQSLGRRVHQRWKDFTLEYPEVLFTAETYGTAKCKVEVRAVEAWAEALKDMFGPPENKVEERDPMEYHTPMDTDLVAAWVEASGDPESEVPKWLVQGAPLGIELPILSCGIFPPADEKKGGTEAGEAITDGELEKKGFKNYLSVETNKEDAEIELKRYENLGFLQRWPKERALQEFQGGTISRLGLVVKLKPDNTKKLRIVIDLRPSGGNAKSTLPERLVLPRPLVQSLRTKEKVGGEGRRRQRSGICSDRHKRRLHNSPTPPKGTQTQYVAVNKPRRNTTISSSIIRISYGTIAVLSPSGNDEQTAAGSGRPGSGLPSDLLRRRPVDTDGVVGGEEPQPGGHHLHAPGIQDEDLDGEGRTLRPRHLGRCQVLLGRQPTCHPGPTPEIPRGTAGYVEELEGGRHGPHQRTPSAGGKGLLVGGNPAESEVDSVDPLRSPETSGSRREGWIRGEEKIIKDRRPQQEGPLCGQESGRCKTMAGGLRSSSTAEAHEKAQHMATI